MGAAGPQLCAANATTLYYMVQREPGQAVGVREFGV